jgi:glutathione S-transferase
VVSNLDGELEEKNFFGGEVFGFVDIVLVPFVPWLPSYGRYGEFSVQEIARGLGHGALRLGLGDGVAWWDGTRGADEA